MANEIAITTALTYAKNGIETVGRGQAAKLLTQAGVGGTFVPEFSVATSETTLQLGGLTTLGWCWFHNLDATNFVSIKTAASGTVMIKIPAASAVLFHFGSGVTAPVAIADTAATLVEYWILKP